MYTDFFERIMNDSLERMRTFSRLRDLQVQSDVKVQEGDQLFFDWNSKIFVQGQGAVVEFQTYYNLKEIHRVLSFQDGQSMELTKSGMSEFCNIVGGVILKYFENSEANFRLLLPEAILKSKNEEEDFDSLDHVEVFWWRLVVEAVPILCRVRLGANDSFKIPEIGLEDSQDSIDLVEFF